MAEKKNVKKKNYLKKKNQVVFARQSCSRASDGASRVVPPLGANGLCLARDSLRYRRAGGGGRAGEGTPYSHIHPHHVTSLFWILASQI